MAPYRIEAPVTPRGYPLCVFDAFGGILSAGTFFGALAAGSVADCIGRRSTVIAGCAIFSIGVALQVASSTVSLLVPGRLIADFGSYRIPMTIQWVFASILGLGLFLLSESPCWYVKKDSNKDTAGNYACNAAWTACDSAYITDELKEFIDNHNYELRAMRSTWADCFRGGWKPSSNLRRVVLGMMLQMMQQWAGVNFIFYYCSTFSQIIGLQNDFLISMITTAINVASTPLPFWTIERFGRRAIPTSGALGMLVCGFVIAIVGTVDQGSSAAGTCLIVFTCVYIFFFASTWGPGPWVVIGEIFPLPIRAKGWFWNFIIGFITPYMVDKGYGNLKARVFFVWGATCTACVFFAYFLVPETKDLSLEQVNCMLEENTPRTSAGWVPHHLRGGDTDEPSLEEADKV